jgi:hypothetical protein
MVDAPPPIPANRHSNALERMRASVLEGPGETDPSLRQAVAARASELWLSGRSAVAIPDPLAGYVDRVALSSYKVVDEDVEDLRAAGYSEDEIFELTIAAAVGCGLSAVATGLAAGSE